MPRCGSLVPLATKENVFQILPSSFGIRHSPRYLLQRLSHCPGQQHNYKQAYASLPGQSGAGMAWQEHNNSHSAFSRPSKGTMGHSKPPVEWQPLQNPGFKDWMRQHQPQPGTQ